MKKQELNEKEISLSKIEAESRLGCAKSRTCKYTMIVNMFAMKTKFLTAITCFLVAAIPVVAQNTESGKDNKEVLNDWDVYEKYQVKEFPYSNLRGFSSCCQIRKSHPFQEHLFSLRQYWSPLFCFYSCLLGFNILTSLSNPLSFLRFPRVIF